MKPFGLNYVHDIKLFDGIENLFESMEYLDKSGYIDSKNAQVMNGSWSFGGANLTVQGFNYVNNIKWNDLSKVYSCVDVLNVMKPFGLNYVHDIKLFDGIENLFESMEYLDKSGYIDSKNAQVMNGSWSFGGANLTTQGFNYVNS